MLKISSGLLKGMPLVAPKVSSTRPSGERLRQAVFNVLRNFRWPPEKSESEQNLEQSILNGATVADLFSGSGALGIEALSNGAEQACFVEQNSIALKALKQNLDRTTQSFVSQKLNPPKINLIQKDVYASFKKLPSCRVVFVDPPYEFSFYAWEKLIELEKTSSRISSGGLLIFETSHSPRRTETLNLNLAEGVFKRFDLKIYGDSAVHFFVKLGYEK